MTWHRENLVALLALLDEYAYVPRAPEQRRLGNWLHLIASGRLAAEEWSSDRALTRARRFENELRSAALANVTLDGAAGPEALGATAGEPR